MVAIHTVITALYLGAPYIILVFASFETGIVHSILTPLSFHLGIALVFLIKKLADANIPILEWPFRFLIKQDLRNYIVCTSNNIVQHKSNIFRSIK